MLLEQSAQAKHDVAIIAKYVAERTPNRVSYAHYTTEMRLCSIPNDDEYGEWTPERVGRALVDLADFGWSPFGGTHRLYDAGNLWFSIKVYTD